MNATKDVIGRLERLGSLILALNQGTPVCETRALIYSHVRLHRVFFQHATDIKMRYNVERFSVWNTRNVCWQDLQTFEQSFKFNWFSLDKRTIGLAHTYPTHISAWIYLGLWIILPTEWINKHESNQTCLGRILAEDQDECWDRFYHCNWFDIQSKIHQVAISKNGNLYCWDDTYTWYCMGCIWWTHMHSYTLVFKLHKT